jgi:hypothetical protein
MRTRKAILFALIVLALCVFAYFVPAQSAEDDGTYLILGTPTLTQEENLILNTAREDLATLAETSPTARELLEFYDAHAVRAKFVDNDMFEVLEETESPYDFYVVANPNPIVISDDENTIYAQFYCESGLLMISSMGFGQLVRGLNLAHGIAHARNCTVEEEPDSAPLSSNWLVGEYHAYDSVFAVINEITDNQWLEVVEASALQRQQSCMEHGMKPYDYTFGLLPEDSTRIHECVPLENSLDFGFFRTDLVLSANLYTVEQFAETDDECVAGILNFLHTVYADYIPLDEQEY